MSKQPVVQRGSERGVHVGYGTRSKLRKCAHARKLFGDSSAIARQCMNSAIASRALGVLCRTSARTLGGGNNRKVVLKAPLATSQRVSSFSPAGFSRTSVLRNRLAVQASSIRHMASATAVAPEKAAPKPIYLKDYTAPPYLVKVVYLDFNLGEEETTVKSKLSMTPNEAKGKPLDLEGSPEIVLKDVSIDGKKLEESAYKQTEKGGLVILSPPQVPYTLEITTVIQPQKNTSLEGLYKSSGNFCTQCEAEGFRRITFYPDRPDVMAKFITRIEADAKACPVLLGNGNLTEQGKLANGRHFTIWEDPYPKPCYLFALVAGDLACVEDKFTTMGGRNVILRIYVQAHNADKCSFAMESLIKSMKWDEETFGLEYDLDLFNIVAVDDFNMGAMENKSLNIFNSRLVLATPTTATDADYAAIEAVVGHEYFHNWTGNRVTCRDWFQLSLKEGLTVYRDQEFSADLNSRGVKRISDVSRLRAAQFPQDAGPMAHPVQPDSYIKMDNFYSVTVYEKGAEVVRLYRTMLGVDGFRKGMDLYFKRHDGQAVTVYDFLSAMEDANGADLSGIRPWYTQAGTPRLTVRGTYDAAAKTFAVEASQTTPATPGQAEKQPALIPIAVGLLGPDGKDMPLLLQGESADKAATTKVLSLKESSAKFTFVNVASKPVPSFLRGFSAPVVLDSGLSEDELVFLFANDSDDFNRWEAGQQLLRSLALRLLDAHKEGKPLEMPSSVVEAMRAVLKLAATPGADAAFAARALSLPSEGEISELVAVSDPDAIHTVRLFMLKSLASAMRPELEAALAANSDAKYSNSKVARARRSLKNTALGYLSTLGDEAIAKHSLDRFRSADNMTDQLAALASLVNRDSVERTLALGEFYDIFKDDALVMNKWLGLQAMSDLPGNVARVRELLEHPAFDIKNPNKVYALVGGFAGCPVNFHAKDGSGYEFLGDAVIRLDALNAQVAARMVSGFTRWKKYDEGRQKLMKAQLERIIAGKVSDNVFEIASKSLAA